MTAKRILVPLDGDERSEAIVPVVAAVARDEFARDEAGLAGVPVETVVRFGTPADEIALEAEAFGADVIALAEPPRGRLRGLLTPGVVQRLARKTSVPTLVLRPAAA